MGTNLSVEEGLVKAKIVDVIIEHVVIQKLGANYISITPFQNEK